jgi:hypothetical protein
MRLDFVTFVTWWWETIRVVLGCVSHSFIVVLHISMIIASLVALMDDNGVLAPRVYCITRCRVRTLLLSPDTRIAMIDSIA